MTEYKTFWEAAPFVGGSALLLGGGARVAKGLLDLARRPDPESSPENIEPTEEPIVEVPVPVSHAEAEELRRKGLNVKRAFSLTDLKGGPVQAFGLGVLGTGAIMGGWTLTDKLVDSYRKTRAEATRDAIKNRIKRPMTDDPAEEDVGLHANMKAAESFHFEKKAWTVEHHIVNPLAALLGGGMLLSGVRAYNQASVSGDESAKVKALKSYLKKQKTTHPLISTVPVEVTESAGSPAEQAAANAAL
jgi:hypothetical protein